mmetsp:Transcript_761/g.961  ORF Transcript_761/g.961 Transcript_761/m.961 type:complete len:392 (-) Transcript_761:49-1224(-)
MEETKDQIVIEEETQTSTRSSFLNSRNILWWNNLTWSKALRRQSSELSDYSPQKDVRSVSKMHYASTVVTMLFCLYIVTGIIYYNNVEQWSFTDAVYFTVNTFLSIGYGDMTISGANERFFTAFFVLFGVGFVGTAVGVVLSQEADTKEEDLQKYKKSEAFRRDGGEEKFSIHKWEMKYSRRKFVISIIEIFFVMAVGTIVMGLGEDWTYAEAFYWASVTITTVGFGDFVPTTNALKWFTTFYSMVGVVMMARALSYMAQFPIIQRRIRSERQILRQFKYATCHEDVMSAIGTGEQFKGLGIRKSPDSIDRVEFILNMLVLLNKAAPEEIKECGRAFDALDVQQRGYLTSEDFTKDAIRKRRTSSTEAEEIIRLASSGAVTREHSTTVIEE